MKGNVIVGQSGGPTAAINSSLAGVYRTAKDRGANKVYGMLFGIQGLLQERYIDLSEYITNDLDTELLKRTPAAFLGSCRYKLPEIHENKDVYEKIFSILEKLDIEAFIYINPSPYNIFFLPYFHSLSICFDFISKYKNREKVKSAVLTL